VQQPLAHSTRRTNQRSPTALSRVEPAIATPILGACLGTWFGGRELCAERRFRLKRIRLGAVRSAVNNVRGHYELAVGSFKQREGPWDALETMFVAVDKRDAGTGDKVDDGTRH
jgi:hypothetical protein